MSTELHCRKLEAHEVARVAEIDRSEHITSLFAQNGDRLEEHAVDMACPMWLPGEDGEHSVGHQQAECERHLRAGAVAFGAFSGERLVGIGLMTLHVRPAVAQLAFMHVSDGFRGQGVGATLSAELEQLAREAGDTEVVVSATPSGNTVRFYLGRGYEPMIDPLLELLELEPEDIHMRKAL